MRALAIILLLASSSAHAAVERFAILAGNNSGNQDEPNLRWAEADAAKLSEALVEVGHFPAENVAVLRGRDAASFRRALIALNDRIRARTEAGVEPVLLVYFSGHADARALHLGSTDFDLAELEQLVRGSAAAFRLLIVDACRSGTLTQVKGGTIVPPFPIRIEERLDGEGVVFLTSSSASEDAQESEELGGSFFTHYLVSALLGAADANGDGKIGLREAYGYAYESTLRASSRTLAGMQHPTFHYELRGRADLVLSEPYGGEDRAVLELPKDRTFLVLGDSDTGPVIAEVSAQTGLRKLGLRPGRYFLRSRGRDHLLEGTIQVRSGERRSIDERELERIAYARLVRKGAGPISLVHGTELAYRVRQGLFDGDRACHGATVTQGIDFEALSLGLRAGACRSGFQNIALAASTTEVSFELEAVRAIDLPPITLSLGVSAGLALFSQSFETLGNAPNRFSSAPTAGAGAGVELDLGAGFGLTGRIGGVIYLLREGRDGDTTLAARPALRGGLGLEKRW